MIVRFLPLAILLTCSAAHAGELAIRFTGISEARGQVRVALYASDADYGQWKAFRSSTVAAEAGASVRFADLPKGRYLVSAYQDKNGNGELDKALFGIPTEPYGFSRNPFSRMGPPSFDKAALELGDDTLETSIDLQ